MDVLDGLVIRWIEFRKQWDASHRVGNYNITPTFTDFMDWLVSPTLNNEPESDTNILTTQDN